MVTGTRHYYASWVWSCTNFVQSARVAHTTPPPPWELLHLPCSGFRQNAGSMGCM